MVKPFPKRRRRRAGSRLSNPERLSRRMSFTSTGLTQISGPLSEPTAPGPQRRVRLLNVYRGTTPLCALLSAPTRDQCSHPPLSIRECPCLLWLEAQERLRSPRDPRHPHRAPHSLLPNPNPAKAMNAHTTRRPPTVSAKRLPTLHLLVLQLIVTLLGAVLLTTGLLA
jgi:hypothetical protein